MFEQNHQEEEGEENIIYVSSDSDATIPSGEYEVEKIVGAETRKSGKRYYLVRWKGYSETADSWEPSDSLRNSLDLVVAFEKKQAALAAANKELIPQQLRLDPPPSGIPQRAMIPLLREEIRLESPAKSECRNLIWFINNTKIINLGQLRHNIQRILRQRPFALLSPALDPDIPVLIYDRHVSRTGKVFYFVKCNDGTLKWVFSLLLLVLTINVGDNVGKR